MGLSSNKPPPTSEGGQCRIGVLEANRTVATRVARVLRAASGLSEVAVASDPASLRSAFADEPVLLACDASDLDLALEWCDTRYPTMSVISWTSGDMAPMLDAARRSSHLSSLIGWPAFASMPRPWEIGLATRRLIDPGSGAPRLSELFSWGSTVQKYRPRSTQDRDFVVGEVSSLAERAGATSRLVQRVGEVAHEMLMNAMYDAPVDERGDPIYAHDRKREVELAEYQAPTFRFGADGVNLAMQVVDPFGRLTRRHVLEGIHRGRPGDGADSSEIIDTSGGGAGLGLSRIYAQSNVMIVDVEPERYTSVTVFFDMDVNPREARSLPVSLHFFGY